MYGRLVNNWCVFKALLTPRLIYNFVYYALFEFVGKLFNFDEKVIWRFLALIAKNKLGENGTLSLISIGVSFLMNAEKVLKTLIPPPPPVSAMSTYPSPS